LATCPRCDTYSLPPGDESAQDLATEPVEVLYLTETTNGVPKRGKKIFLAVLRSWYFFGIPIMCAWLAIANHDRVVFAVGTVFGVQLAYIYLRGRRFSGPIIDDPQTRSRVSPPLMELCAAAGVAVPHVRIKRTAIPAAVVRQNKFPTLWLSPDFIEIADDAELRAIIAHEVTHLQKGDLALAQRNRSWMVLFVSMVAVGFVLLRHTSSWLPVAMLYAFVFPVFRLIAIVIGLSARKHETIADLDGAVLARDPQAMITGLRLVYGLGANIKRRVFGPRRWRWLLYPYTLPSTSHPPLEERVARLQELTLPPLTAESSGTASHQETSLVTEPRTSAVAGSGVTQPRRVVFPVVVVIVVVTALVLVFRTTVKSSISPSIESPGGAHYMALQSLGLSYSILGFAPLSANQRHDVFITVKQAVSTAESSEGVHPKNGVTMTVAEGNVNRPSLAGGNAVFYNTSVPANWQAAYIVVFSGPKLASEGFSGTEVVVINAYNDAVLNSFIVDNLP
jgi:Zn-dependent protease with chaperone function